MPDPYITATPNELIRAVDWNNIQVQARTEIQGHGHSGGDDGVQITSTGLADGAVTASKLPDGVVTTSKLANGSVTLAKLAPDAAAGILSEPVALDVTGSTVDAVPLAPVFDPFALSVSPGANQVLPRDETLLNLDAGPLLSPLLDMLATQAGEVGGELVIARVLHTMIDNLSRELIEHLGSASAVHGEVAGSLPAYTAQLAQLAGPGTQELPAPAITLALNALDTINAEPTRVIRNFAYAFLSFLEFMISPFTGTGSLGDLATSTAATGLVGDIINTYPSLSFGVMQPLSGSDTLRVLGQETNNGVALMDCQAELVLVLPPDSPCVLGIGTETMPPPPTQLSMAWPSANAGDSTPISVTLRRVQAYLPPRDPDLIRSVRLWGSLVGSSSEPAMVTRGRIECRHLLLRPHANAQVLSEDTVEPWNDAPP